VWRGEAKQRAQDASKCRVTLGHFRARTCAHESRGGSRRVNNRLAPSHPRSRVQPASQPSGKSQHTHTHHTHHTYIPYTIPYIHHHTPYTIPLTKNLTDNFFNIIDIDITFSAQRIGIRGQRRLCSYRGWSRCCCCRRRRRRRLLIGMSVLHSTA